MKNILTSFVFFAIILSSCKKEFLDKKPNDALVVPSTLSELQALLDNDNVMNGSSMTSFSGPSPALMITGNDDYFVPDDYYNSFFELFHKNLYTWEKDNVYGAINQFSDWDAPYRTIFYSNLVLKQLAKTENSQNNIPTYNNIKGSSLFFRAYAYFHLAQVFAPVFDNTTAGTDLGLPLRLDPDVNYSVGRSTLKQTYDQIIKDLNEAVDLLPGNPLYKTRPSKQAAFALLARIYLSMRDYQKALQYATSALAINNKLLDYNSLPTGLSFSFERFNDEVIFSSVASQDPLYLYHYSLARVDSNLYSSYTSDDIRKTLFFDPGAEPGTFYFKGSYDGREIPFMGLANDELFLIKAESNARLNHIPEAVSDLNILLSKRYQNYVPSNITNPSQVLALILEERKKELIFRGTRWSDLRRFNKDGANITIKRKVNGQEIVLPPNDVRYVWPIPNYVLGFNPSVKQNPR